MKATAGFAWPATPAIEWVIPHMSMRIHTAGANMYLDHPKITATRSDTEPDRLERLNRVYGYAIGLAESSGDTECITKLARLHDHKGNLIVVWSDAPTERQKSFFAQAWQSKVGDGTTHVEHEVQPVGSA
jgi:hypothetical protein